MLERGVDLVVRDQLRSKRVRPAFAVRAVLHHCRDECAVAHDVVERHLDAACRARPGARLPLGRHPLEQNLTAVVDMTGAGPEHGVQLLLLRSVEKVAREHDDGEGAAEVERLDVGETVSAPRTCDSISAELSTAVTLWPSAISSCVIRPAPQPSSRIRLPCRHRSVDQLGLAERGKRGVETDRAPVRGVGAHGRTLSRYRPAVAVATNEYGLFINGETVEGSPSATWSSRPRARRSAHAARGRGRDRSRGRGRTRGARRRLGQDARDERSRLLHALADAIKANRNELSELESRNVGKAISSTKAELFGAVENSATSRPRSARSAAARTRSAARSSPTR